MSSISTSGVKTIYYVDHISSAHQKVIEHFNRKYNGSIRVETINLSFDKFSTNERKELLARYLRSRNDRIDVFAVDQIWVPRFARWAVPLQNLLDEKEVNDVIPNALQTCIYQDTLVAAPLYIDIAVLFYRDDLLKQLPDYKKIIGELNSSITWENFVSLNQKINRNKTHTYIYQADDYEGLICQFAELMAELNNPIVGGKGELLINTSDGRKSLQLLVDLVNKYKVSPKDVTYLKENESFRFFAEHDDIFLRSWSSMIDDEVEYLSDEVRKNLRMAPTPHFQGSSKASVYGGWNLMISKFSENVPEAVKFVKFLLSEESQQIMFEEGGYLPINGNLYRNNELIQKHGDLIFFQELFKVGIYRPFMEGYTTLSDILAYYLNRAIKGETTVEQALIDSDRDIRAKGFVVK